MKLCVFDFDSTLMDGETIDFFAEPLGLKDKVAAITEKAMQGEMDFFESLTERVSLLKGLGLWPGALAFIRGSASDLASAFLPALLLFALTRAPGGTRRPWSLKAPMAVLWLLWATLAGLNAEHILVNDTNMYGGFLGLALSGQFILGSVLTLKTAKSVAVCLLPAAVLLLPLRA